MADFLFYSKPVAVNNVRHKKLKPVENYRFAAEVNSVPLVLEEFAEAAKHYAIVFVTSPKGELVPVIVLGVRNSENVFVDPDGQWNVDYIPAACRQYPFVLGGDANGDTMTIFIDEAHTGVNAEAGVILFEPDGSRTAFLDKAVEFMTAYHRGLRATAEFCAALEELDLMREISLDITLLDGERLALNGVRAVDESKLLALSSDAAASLTRRGFLAPAYFHLQSLSNLQRMLNKYAK